MPTLSQNSTLTQASLDPALIEVPTPIDPIRFEIPRPFEPTPDYNTTSPDDLEESNSLTELVQNTSTTVAKRVRRKRRPLPEEHHDSDSLDEPVIRTPTSTAKRVYRKRQRVSDAVEFENEEFPWQQRFVLAVRWEYLLKLHIRDMDKVILELYPRLTRSDVLWTQLVREIQDKTKNWKSTTLKRIRVSQVKMENRIYQTLTCTGLCRVSD